MAKRTKKTQALARRRRKPVRAPMVVPVNLPQRYQAPDAAPALLGDEVALGALGVVEVKLTPAEEAVLSERVNVAAVLIKPTGQPYLSHPEYTKWFNRAFGRLGWAIAPCAKPRHDGKSITCPYLLYIHGQPAAFAMGEQEYFENNKEQTYGDAYEATVASALRRCAKRLGVGLELWDRAWLNTFIEEQCVKVWIEGKDKPQWRRRVDPPFWNEGRGKGRQTDQAPKPAERRGPPPVPSAVAAELITLPDRAHLIDLVQSSGRTEDAVRQWLATTYQITSTKQITRAQFAGICRAIEAPGELR